MPADDGNGRRLRSRRWFDDPADPAMTALYLERYMNYGITPDELRGGKPIIGIAQTGSDLSPCNRHHIELASRVRDGIRAAGGVPLEFPIHPIQETGKRPTAALDRNLAYLSLVEVLHGYPIDGVVLTTGCDKTTPACLMGAATVNIPAIVLSGGPMLDGWWQGRLSGSGTIVWEGRKLFAEGKIGYDEFMQMVSSSAPSVGHCNTMGTATSMNSLAEALGMSLPGCAAIPAPYRERGWMAYETGQRIVGMVHENLRPSDIMTKQAFENAVVAAAALGASSNCPIHMVAIARHMGVEHSLDDWQRLGPGHSAAGGSAAGRPVPRREIPSRRRRAGGAEGTAGRGQAAWRRDDRHRQDAGRKPARRAGWRPRGDPLLRQSDEGGRRLRGDVGQPVRQRGDEDQRHRSGFPQALPVESGRARTCSRARRSCSRGRRTTTIASRIPISAWRSSRC